MKPDRGNSPACRETQRQNISRNIYLLVCPYYGEYNKPRRNNAYKKSTLYLRMKVRTERHGRDNRHNGGKYSTDRGNRRGCEFVRLPCKSRYDSISIHHTRRTGRGSEIPVSWILRKLSTIIYFNVSCLEYIC